MEGTGIKLRKTFRIEAWLWYEIVITISQRKVISSMRETSGYCLKGMIPIMVKIAFKLILEKLKFKAIMRMKKPLWVKRSKVRRIVMTPKKAKATFLSKTDWENEMGNGGILDIGWEILNWSNLWCIHDLECNLWGLFWSNFFVLFVANLVELK